MEPTGEDGKRLHEVLNKLDVTNESRFLAALCAQEKEAADEIAMRLSLFSPVASTVLRVAHAMHTSCDERKIKEIIVALEQSGNNYVLTEILKWAEESLKVVPVDSVAQCAEEDP